MKFAYLIEPPFNYVDQAGNITGCDVMLARHVLNMVGFTAFDPVETDFAELLPGLAAGRWRMTTGLFATAERRQIALFSRPIWALSDGLLVREGNPLDLTGYQSIADHAAAKLAVIQDQVQHRSALNLGVHPSKITTFTTYEEAAQAVFMGQVDAYASVDRAHMSFIDANPDMALCCMSVPPKEHEPGCGSFTFGLNDTKLREDVDAVLSEFIGSDKHRDMVAKFGFSDQDVDLVVAVAR